ANQIAIGGALAGVSEAFAVARKAGVDISRVREALLGGFAASRVLEVHGERMIKKNYAPGFRAKLYQKDLRLANEIASASAVAVPATAVITQLVNALIASGGGVPEAWAVSTLRARGARNHRHARRPRPHPSVRRRASCVVLCNATVKKARSCPHARDLAP